MLTKPLYCHWVLGRAQFKPWGIEKHSVLYMIEVVLTNILVQGRVIYPYIDRFFYSSCLPPVPFPMMLMFCSSMGCPMVWECPYIGDGCLRCSFLLPPVSCQSLLCILHCSPVEGTCSCRLNHFCCPWGLYLWVS